MSHLIRLLAALWVVGCTALPLPREGNHHESDADVAVTRIAHGGLVVALGGTTLLVDPWFHAGWTVQQTEPLGLTPERLPAADAILLTHDHPTHVDREALEALATKIPRVIAPPPLATRLGPLGFRDATALDWWQHATVGAIRITAVPADHAVRENGYVVESRGAAIYLAGDTKLFDGLRDVAAAFPRLDVAFLPIGGERLLGMKRTMSPADAAQATTLLSPRRVVPIAYGAAGIPPFHWWASAPVAAFRSALGDVGFDRNRVVVLAPGESWHYYRP